MRTPHFTRRPSTCPQSWTRDTVHWLRYSFKSTPFLLPPWNLFSSAHSYVGCWHHQKNAAGSGMWVGGDGRAAPRHADTNGVLPHGVWIVPSKPTELQPAKSPQSIVHLSGVAFPREHGSEAKTHQDSNTRGSLRSSNSTFEL